MFLKGFVEEMSAAVDHFQREPALLTQVVQACLSHGKTVLIATGKPYHAAVLAAKIAQSYRLPWHSLDATHVQHGDAGLIRPRDFIIYISKSGESKEVLEAAAYLGSVDSLALTCNLESRLVSLVTVGLLCPLVYEHSLYGRAPMSSTLVFLAILFEIINQVAGDSGSEEAYLSSHPGGEIGASAI